MKKYDVIVIGLGAMGSAALYQLAKRRTKVLGLDQYTPPHTLGSTHGDTRLTRLAIGEGEEYVPLVFRSNEIWKEIEKETNQKLLNLTGGLIITSSKNSVFFDTTVASAEKYNIEHSLFDAQQMKKRFPQFNLQGDERGYYEKNAGFLRPELCIQMQLHMAKKYGAEIKMNEKVLNYKNVNNHVIIRTEKESYVAEKIIISTGPWISEFLDPELRNYFTVYKQVLYWFAVEHIEPFTIPQFPVWIWDMENGNLEGIYGFPAINGPLGGIKIAEVEYSDITTPEKIQRQVTKEEIQTMYKKYVKPYLLGVTATCLKSTACMYTVTPDFKFIIDRHPAMPNVIVASPCSGHGFKHSAAIGEVLAQLALDGKSTIDSSTFSFARFDKKAS